MKHSDPAARHAIPPELLPFAVEIDSIQRWPGNPREHDIPALRGSLVEFGQPRAILAQKGSRRIFAGNGLHEAAEAEGWTHIAATFRDWPDLKCRQYLLADNKLHERGGDNFEAMAKFLGELAEEGGLISAIGYEQREVDRFLASLVGTPEQTIPNVDASAVRVKPGDVYRLGDHVLACGDAFDWPLLDRLGLDRTADCIFTSPPYAVGIDYGPEYADTIDNLRSSISKAAHTWLSVVRPGGFAVINFGDVVTARPIVGGDEPCEYPMALEYWPAFRGEGWALWSRRVWCKPHARVSAPWTSNTNRAAFDFEHVWTWRAEGDDRDFAVLGERADPDFESVWTWKAPGAPVVGRLSGQRSSANGWFDTTRDDDGVEIGKGEHAAGMALGVAQRMIAIHSRRGGIVHEPFMGTGTTLIAAEQLGRRCIGTELSPRYVQITIERWQAFTRRTAEKVA